jgi:hypothetical protein
MRTIQGLMTATVIAACLMLSGPAEMHGYAAGRSTLQQQLAAARAATARFHDPSEAVAAGYTYIGPIPGEAGTIDFVNFNLIDCTLDVTQPEALRYVASGNGLRLVGVEYSIPMACAATPPADFLPGAGEWEQEPGVPAWSMAVFIWSGNSLESR